MLYIKNLFNILVEGRTVDPWCNGRNNGSKQMKKNNTRKSVINRAWQINEMLENLRKKVNILIDEIADVEENEDFDDFSLKSLRYALEDLSSFDLEDSIVTAE